MVYFVQIISAAIGVAAFSVIFNSKRKNLGVLALGGGLGWAAYLLTFHLFKSEPLGYFFASCVICIYSEVFARILKTPSTAVLIPVIVPLVPGGMLYYTMRLAFQSNWREFFPSGIHTLNVVLSIALGIILVSTVIKVSARKGGGKND